MHSQRSDPYRRECNFSNHVQSTEFTIGDPSQGGETIKDDQEKREAYLYHRDISLVPFELIKKNNPKFHFCVVVMVYRIEIDKGKK